ncbi:class I SAM-dependent methyltransferase [Rothia uropygialis]|uniref:class I SAM-dependent methyltransferase n=1 Tax=Kocuria sp. 36 TaxID=1415402 RepID=UPI00101CF8C1|nr:methyltransferase domain-containing protein [Kocuria sp. 36]
MREPSLWEIQKRKNPGHSRWYIERFETMRANGADLDGEARTIDALTHRSSTILDAGCGPGRVGGELARRGHQVVGVDVDPELVEQANRDHPSATWLTGDLAELGTVLPAESLGTFDVIVCAGNVMTFLAPSTRRAVLEGFRTVLTPGGRAAIGFGGGRGYAFEDYFSDAEAAGLEPSLTLGTWDLEPFDQESNFLVSILRKPVNPANVQGQRTSLLG